MTPRDRASRLTGVPLIAALLTACAVQLVAPYNADLQQKASSMQAEVASWDLTMRSGAGTIADDPRHPDVIKTLNKWRGESDAMLTLAVSNAPNIGNCSDAAKAVSGAIESHIPPDLRAATTTGDTSARPSGCEATLVADMQNNIAAIERALRFCRVEWIPDAYFTNLALEPTKKPPVAPTRAQQDALDRSCLAEFKAAAQTPTNAADTQHGRAVSALLTTLQVIVYVENRKKVAGATTR